MIVRPEKKDIVQMKNIWRLCFGDDRETVDYYYKTCFSFDDCFISKNGETVEAVIQLIPCEIKADEKSYNAKYMYAVCTHPSFQGRGIMTSLISEAMEREKAAGTDAVLCIPASESLFDFYSCFGFENAAYCSHTELKRSFIENNARQCEYSLNGEISSFNDQRNKLLRLFPDSAFVEHRDNYLALSNGFGYLYVYTNNSYAVFTVEDDCIRIADSFCGCEKGFEELCYVLKNETHAENYIFDYTNGKGNDVLMGQIILFNNQELKDKKIYFGVKME